MRRIIVILAVVGIALLPLSGAAGGPVSATWGVEQLLVLLAVGAAIRLTWVGVGLLRLSRIRKKARPLQTPCFSSVKSPRRMSADGTTANSVPLSGTCLCNSKKPKKNILS